MRKFVFGEYLDHPTPGDPRTIGIPFHKRVLESDGGPVEFQIWENDQGGYFQSLERNAFLGSQFVLVCYDVSDAVAFAGLPELIEKINKNSAEIHGKYAQIPPFHLGLVGCKTDLPATIPERTVVFLAEHYGCPFHLQCSAVLGTGVDAIFTRVLDLLDD